MTPLRLRVVPFVSMLDRFAMPPMMVTIASSLGVPLSSVVHALAAYVLAYGLTQPVWGLLSDRFGLVGTVRVALALAGASAVASAFSGSVLALGLTRGLAGACFGAAIPASLIYVGDTVPSRRRQHEVARLMAGVAVGTALASVGAGALAEHGSWRAAFVLTGVAAIALAAALGGLPPPTAPRRRQGLVAPMRAIVRSRPTRLVLALVFVEGAVLLGALTLLPAAVESAGAGASVAGAVTAAYGVAVLVCSHVVGRISGWMHPWRLIALGSAAAVLACGLVTVARSPATALASAGLLGVAWTFMHSTLQTWATEVLPGARAMVVSAFAGALFLGGAAAHTLTGGLAEAQRYAEIFGGVTVLAIPLGLCAVLGRRRWRPSEGDVGP